MEIDIITAFPKFFESPFDVSLVHRARQKGILSLRVHDLRQFSFDKHKQIDDYPFGGGPGMILKPEPFFIAVDEIQSNYGQGNIIFPTPDGKLFTQEIAHRLTETPHIIFLCGHYKGIDERVREKLVDEEISIGDYILSGGEIPTLLIADAVIRLIPGVMGNRDSADSDSFENGTLDHPHYTRPAVYKGMEVPSVLRSGNHKEIEKWRTARSLEKTRQRRRDLLESSQDPAVTEKENE